MANVVFFILPEQGHLNATLKLGKTLTSRGHRVYYLQILEFEEYLGSQGMEFIPLFETIFHQWYDFSPYQPPYNNMLLRLGFEAAARRVSIFTIMGQELRARLDGVGAHLLVLDVNIGMTPKKLEVGIPAVMLNPTLLPPRIDSCPEVPILTLCPEQFDLPRAEGAPQHLYVEASVDLQREEAPFPWHRVEENRRLAYCSLGTQSHWTYGCDSYESIQRTRADFLQTVVSAFADRSDWQLILSMGGHDGTRKFHSIPSNAILINKVPQIAVLKKASLMITHGGLNSVKECILTGVPMIVFPLMHDQFLNADCIVYHGLGLSGDIETATETIIHSMIDEVDSNPVFRDGIGAMRDIFRRAESEERAIAIIEGTLASATR